VRVHCRIPLSQAVPFVLAVVLLDASDRQASGRGKCWSESCQRDGIRGKDYGGKGAPGRTMRMS
jgi:hypothetical protein